MLKAREPSGLPARSARWDPEDPEAKAQTKSWGAGGGRESEEREPCIGYQRPLGRAAAPKRKLVREAGILLQWETTSLGATERLRPWF